MILFQMWLVHKIGFLQGGSEEATNLCRGPFFGRFWGLFLFGQNYSAHRVRAWCRAENSSLQPTTGWERSPPPLTIARGPDPQPGFVSNPAHLAAAFFAVQPLQDATAPADARRCRPQYALCPLRLGGPQIACQAGRMVTLRLPKEPEAGFELFLAGAQ